MSKRRASAYLLIASSKIRGVITFPPKSGGHTTPRSWEPIPQTKGRVKI